MAGSRRDVRLQSPLVGGFGTSGRVRGRNAPAVGFSWSI